MLYVMVFFMFNDLRLEVKFVHFVNIGGSVDQITVLPFPPCINWGYSLRNEDHSLSHVCRFRFAYAYIVYTMYAILKRKVKL
jgi:hypothetical protein